MSVTVRLFAALRERRGQSSLSVKVTPDETVGSLFEKIFEHPPEADGVGPLVFALNRSYVERSHPVVDGDEIAFIPPLGGGAGDPRVLLSEAPLDLAPLIDHVSGPNHGGVVSFTGTVRDHFKGRKVTHLEYEAYRAMALEQMTQLCDAIEARWPGVRVAMAHRVGRLEIGEAAVHVVAAGAHRPEAFEACRFGIDRLKEVVPIFKKELYTDGSTWKGQGGG